MPAAAYDPFKDETLGRVPPKTRIRVDWKRGAKLLAGGEPAEAIAAALGITEERLWRHFNKSLRFRFLFRQALERYRLTAKLAFEEAARRAAVQRCGRVEEIDGGSWQWLAREAGLTHDDADTAGNETGGSRPGREARLAAALKDAGSTPPNQALRERLRKERKAMDALVAEFRARDRAAGILPPTPTNAAPGPDKAPINENKTQISTDKTQVSENKIQISADTHGCDAKPPEEPEAAKKKGNAEPAPPETGAFQPHHYRSVIDLTDIHGNPLPGREHLLRE